MADMAGEDNVQEAWGRFLFSLAKKVPESRFESFREETHQISKCYLGAEIPALPTSAPDLNNLSGLSSYFNAPSASPSHHNAYHRLKSQAMSMMSSFLYAIFTLFLQ